MSESATAELIDGGVETIDLGGVDCHCRDPFVGLGRAPGCDTTAGADSFVYVCRLAHGSDGSIRLRM